MCPALSLACEVNFYLQRSHLERIPHIFTAVYNHWTGLVDWTSGKLTFSVLKITFVLFNKSNLRVGLHNALYWPENNLLMLQTDFEQARPQA